VAASSWVVKKSRLVNQSTLGKDLVNSGQIIYFMLYLAGGSSIGTLNWPKKEKIVWRQFTTNQTNSGNFPESQSLKMEYTNPT